MDKFMEIITKILLVIFVLMVILSGVGILDIGYLVFHTWGVFALICFIWFIIVISS
jgi:hypothetical protein|nr:MAG TPA: hypothetical protein [Caudoviricetes sp.]